METEREKIGKRIAELRKEADLSQAELAEKIGTQQGNIARIELGKYNIGYDTLEAIAKALNLKVDFIKEPPPK